MLVLEQENNPVETGFTSCIVLMTLGVFAYTISSIGQILEELS
jgi:hypothetical protein